MNKIDIFNIMIGVVIGALLTVFATKKDNNLIIREKIVRDTITKTAEPIIIEKAKPELKYIKDTIIVTKPFIATIDTIVRYDTIKVSYQYPNNDMSIMVVRKPDTLITNTIYITKYQEIKRPLYIDILSHVGAGLFGFTIGTIR